MIEFPGNFSFFKEEKDAIFRNGDGQSKILLILRQYLISQQNFSDPNFVVRYLQGKGGKIEPDNYDPVESEHPFLDPEVIEQEWNDIKSYKQRDFTQNQEIGTYFKNLNDKITRVFGKDITSEQVSLFEKSRIKKYLKRQLAKKVSFGNLEQLLAYDIEYPHEVNQINDFLEKTYTEFKGFKIKLDGMAKIEKKSKKEKIKIETPRGTSTIIDLNAVQYLILSSCLTCREEFLMKTNNSNILQHTGYCPWQVLLIDDPFQTIDDNVKELLEYMKSNLVDTLGIQIIIRVSDYMQYQFLKTNNFGLSECNFYTLNEVKDVSSFINQQHNNVELPANNTTSNSTTESEESKAGTGHVVEENQSLSNKRMKK
jgi:hypothetical protein